MTITKAQLLDSITKQVDLCRAKSAEVTESLLKIIKKTLEDGGDILISGFGKFCVKEKRKRRGRNPQTGKDIMLGERRVVTFKCSRRLRDVINGEG